MKFSFPNVPRAVTKAGTVLFIGLVVSILLPVLIFEMLTADQIDVSLQSVADGSLVNLSEKQLFAAHFRIITSGTYGLKFGKSDTVMVDQYPVPAYVGVWFNRVKGDVEDFYEPLNISFCFASGDCLLVTENLSRISRQEMVSMNKGQNVCPAVRENDSGGTKNWPYFLKNNLYYFRFDKEMKPDIDCISTDIFSGKLFLMLKFYVCRIYSFLPASIQPGWYLNIGRKHF